MFRRDLSAHLLGPLFLLSVKLEVSLFRPCSLNNNKYFSSRRISSWQLQGVQRVEALQPALSWEQIYLRIITVKESPEKLEGESSATHICDWKRFFCEFYLRS